MRDRKYLSIAIVNFFLAACLGALMRYAFVNEVPGVEFRNLMHGHSHVAMLGWLYQALYLLLIYHFLGFSAWNAFFKRLFWVTQISVFGMFIFFPIQGYGLFSIIFSTLHVFCSYVFVWQFLKALKKRGERRTPSIVLIRASLWFMVLSTAGLWCMALIMATGLKNASLYYGSVQFFLHFQFNGWYIFAILGLILRWFEDGNLSINKSHFKLFYYALVVSCLLTFALAVTWSTPLPILFFTNSLGVGLQILALIVLIYLIKGNWSAISGQLNKWTRFLMFLGFASFTMKIIMQGAVIIPDFATIAYTIRNFVIGFIHLILLAMVTSFIIAFSVQNNWLNVKSKLVKVGIIILFSGIVLTEALLFLQGTMLWARMGFMDGYYETIFAFSLLIPVGVLILIGSRIKESRRIAV